MELQLEEAAAAEILHRLTQAIQERYLAAAERVRSCNEAELLEARIEFRVLHEYMNSLQAAAQGFFREQADADQAPTVSPMAPERRNRFRSGA